MKKKKELRKTNGGFSSADHSVGSLTELAFLGNKIARISVPPISFFLKKKIMINKKKEAKSSLQFLLVNGNAVLWVTSFLFCLRIIWTKEIFQRGKEKSKYDLLNIAY